jgi:hypothetical protein
MKKKMKFFTTCVVCFRATPCFDQCATKGQQLTRPGQAWQLLSGT